MADLKGAFGKRLFNYVRDNDCSIEFVGMSEDERRAMGQLVSGYLDEKRKIDKTS